LFFVLRQAQDERKKSLNIRKIPFALSLSKDLLFYFAPNEKLPANFHASWLLSSGGSSP